MIIESNSLNYVSEERSTLSMLKSIFSIAMPSVIFMLSSILLEVINLSYVGHLGSQTMVAGVGLGNMYFNATGLSLLFGLNSTVVTLISQALG